MRTHSEILNLVAIIEEMNGQEVEDVLANEHDAMMSDKTEKFKFGRTCAVCALWNLLVSFVPVGSWKRTVATSGDDSGSGFARSASLRREGAGKEEE